MLPPLDKKTRALTTLYGPRTKYYLRQNKTAQPRGMLEDLPIKPGLSPFHPLPAIGYKPKETKVYVLDLNKNETMRPATVEDRTIVLKPLTPLRIHGFNRTRSNSLEHLDSLEKPQQLVRENTYDLIKPIFLKAQKVQRRGPVVHSPKVIKTEHNRKPEESPKWSPRSRFKKAAMEIAKLSSVPETGKLLCLREKQTFKLEDEDNDDCYQLKQFAGSPTHKLNKLSEIFQNLEVKGHHRMKVKKENSWF